VHHGAAHEAATHLAAQTHRPTHLQSLLHIGVEIEKPQGAGVAAVIHHGLQLAARLEHHVAAFHDGFDLDHLAITRIGELDQLGFVLVAKRQVQRHVHRTQQAHFAQGFLRCAQGLGRLLGALRGSSASHARPFPTP
jgi:hypothetical protein